MNADEIKDKPIPGPSPVGPEYVYEPDPRRPAGPALVLGRKLLDMIRVPAHWVRENIVEPNRGPKYYWYHRKYQRALPIDECYIDDHACLFEANLDYRRTFAVDRSTLDLLRYRRDSCHFWNLTTKNIKGPSENCQELEDIYDREELNFHIKYGDLPYGHNVFQAYTKQKHRMIMERRKAIEAEQEALKVIREE